MITPNKVLVVTTNSLDGLKIQKYLKPISSHVVAGTNVFSDLSASFSDFFGGRSGTYQRQLASLYNEAIESVKVSAFELGANCVVGLKVDMDEISGNNKSMFMITVVGTAVIVENLEQYDKAKSVEHSNDGVSLEKIKTLTKKRQIVKEAGFQNWNLTDEVWDFIIDNQVEEVFPFLLQKYDQLLEAYQAESAKVFYKQLLTFINGFPAEKKSDILYLTLLTAKKDTIIKTLSEMIRDLKMLDLKFIYNVLVNDEWANKQKSLQLLAFEKPFYGREDITDLQQIKQVVTSTFNELGVKSIKKGSLLSKDKEVWTCTCGEVNDDNSDGKYCNKCFKDIYGFKKHQLNPIKALEIIDNKIDLISYFVK